MQRAEMGEFAFIARIQRQFSAPCNFVPLGIGDDAAAVIPSPGKYSLLTTDTLIEGTHFNRAYSTFEQVGLKALAVNLSDIAAMGGRARAFLVSLGVPQNMPLSDLTALYRGIAKASRAASIVLIGGNTTCSKGPFFITVTLLGEASKKQMVTRAGANQEDAIYVTGTVGDAAAGLDCLQKGHSVKANAALIRRHQIPRARSAEGLLLGQLRIPSAMIDLSDGLTADLDHLLTQSGVGAELRLDHIPVSPALKRYAKRHEVDTLDFALSGGEDYELLFTVSETKGKKLEKLIKRGLIQATRIGTILPKKAGLIGRTAEGKTRKIAPGGYDHFARRKPLNVENNE